MKKVRISLPIVVQEHATAFLEGTYSFKNAFICGAIMTDSFVAFFIIHLRHNAIEIYSCFFFPNISHSRNKGIVILCAFKRAVSHAFAEIKQFCIKSKSFICPLVNIFYCIMVSQGRGPYCALPLLSTYLAHKGIESTEKYLRLTKQYYRDILRYNEEDAEEIFPEV